MAVQFWMLLAALVALGGLACGAAKPLPPGAGIRVAATTTQIADMARQIGGTRAAVHGILPPNTDPHDFEPTPQDVARITDADLVLENGLRLDAWADDMVAESGTDARVVVATQGVATVGDDPHVWFDVANAKIMAANIRDALAAVDPDGAGLYQANAAAYLAQLDALDAWIRTQIAAIPPADRKLVTNHDAFGYYARAYGLTVVGSIIPGLDSQAQPSARSTAKLIDAITAQHVKAVFTEASLNPKLAEQIADEAGVKIVDNLYGDSLGPSGSGADNYIGMLRTDTTLIVDALK